MNVAIRGGGNEKHKVVPKSVIEPGSCNSELPTKPLVHSWHNVRSRRPAIVIGAHQQSLSKTTHWLCASSYLRARAAIRYSSVGGIGRFLYLWSFFLMPAVSLSHCFSCLWRYSSPFSSPGSAFSSWSGFLITSAQNRARPKTYSRINKAWTSCRIFSSVYCRFPYCNMTDLFILVLHGYLAIRLREPPKTSVCLHQTGEKLNSVAISLAINLEKSARFRSYLGRIWKLWKHRLRYIYCHDAIA